MARGCELKATAKRILRRIPGVTGALQAYSFWRQWFHLRRFKGTQDLFTSYFRNNEWGCAESRSGPGSTIAFTETVRKGIEDLIGQLVVRIILDAPCGDYNWFRLIPREENVHYVGGDIVEPLIERNRSLYGTNNTAFVKLDITRDRLPGADMWLCRDCLPHFSYKHIFQTIHNFLRSEIPFLLTSTWTECTENTDMPTGSFRALNLELPPFDFCKPLLYIDDWIEGHPVRKLGLWEKQALTHALAANKRLQQSDRNYP
jgi:hypothetical protein